MSRSTTTSNTGSRRRKLCGYCSRCSRDPTSLQPARPDQNERRRFRTTRCTVISGCLRLGRQEIPQWRQEDAHNSAVPSKKHRQASGPHGRMCPTLRSTPDIKRGSAATIGAPFLRKAQPQRLVPRIMWPIRQLQGVQSRAPRRRGSCRPFPRSDS